MSTLGWVLCPLAITNDDGDDDFFLTIAQHGLFGRHCIFLFMSLYYEIVRRSEYTVRERLLLEKNDVKNCWLYSCRVMVD
jgi:hypothetical protein